uniref:Uncharacterized protein n=1 Tax=Arundo donax TaxID=35708 RepID=A0A0A9MGF5_ARUDO
MILMQEIPMHVWCQFAECVEELKNETIKEYKTDKFTLHKDKGQCLPEATCGKEEVVSDVKLIPLLFQYK